MWRKGNHSALLGIQTGAATVESGIEIPQKLKIELPFDPEIPLLKIYLKKPETLIQKNVCTLMFIAVLFIVATIWKHSKCPSVDEWIKPLWYICTLEYYLAVKKERRKENFTLCDSMGGPGEHYAK